MGKTVRIGNRTVGCSHPAFIIAEIGINHNGSLDIAKSYLRAQPSRLRCREVPEADARSSASPRAQRAQAA